MKRHRHAIVFVLASVGAVGGCVGSEPTDNVDSIASPLLSGAIFTTTVDGSFVNANIYDAKEDVYLDGGPGPNAPASAAGLPAGYYYFQVTDPSGHTLLSSDPLSCRIFHVGSSGLIDSVGGGGCAHATGIDQDHGAITVQLMPYDDTPNPGGEYKVWVTPVDKIGDLDSPTHGFVHRYSKTDNFKVQEEVVTPPVCGDGHTDAGEECDDGNTVSGDGCSSECMIEYPPPPPCCGNGVMESGEECDDGNTMDGDGCSAQCMIEYPPPPPCCGNGVMESGEECDDGNNVDGDGCSSQCMIECPPPPPPPCCGNGVMDSGEECDDGNTVDGDGCSSTCTIEPCPNQPN